MRDGHRTRLGVECSDESPGSEKSAPLPTEAHHDGTQIDLDALRALTEVSARLASSLDLPAVLQSAIDGAVTVLCIPTGATYLLECAQLHLGATTPPLADDFPEEMQHAPLAHHPHIERALSTQSPVSCKMRMPKHSHRPSGQ